MTDLQAYLLSDRQWKRAHRIAHAKLLLQYAELKEDKAFWNAVLEANGAVRKQRRGKR